MVAPFICKKCFATFSTLTHLRRHHQSHNLSKSHSCFFCSAAFSRKDTARRHAKACPERCGRPLPKIENGRPPASCDNCALEKTSCDKRHPCEYCESNQLSCTYSRVVPRFQDPLPEAAPSNLEVGNATGGNEVENPPRARGNLDTLTKARIPFLLNYYDDNNTLLDYFPALEAGRPKVIESVALPCLPDRAAFMSHDFPALDLEEVYWDLPDVRPSNDTHPQATPNTPADHQLVEGFSQRALEIVKVLEPFASDDVSRSNFNKAIDQNLFSPTNMRDFEHLYKQHSHKHCPILHLPTFDAESATMPLLLAIFLSGSLHSYPRDTFQLAADCFDIVEAYLFSLPVFQIKNKEATTTQTQLRDIHESLIAAVLLLNIQFGQNDSVTRQRLRYQRFPMLAHAARSLSLFDSKHDGEKTTSDDWIWDPQSESLIRTASYILLLDSQFVVSLRSPPMISISEFSGHLPCAEAMFHHDRSPSLVNIPRPSSLVEAIDFLMNDTSTNLSSHPIKSIGIFGLFAIMAGLHLIIYTSFTNRMIHHQVVPLERALATWKFCWESLMSQIDHEEIELAGFMANANEFWLVARVLLKTDLQDFFRGQDSQSPKPLSTLLRRVNETPDI